MCRLLGLVCNRVTDLGFTLPIFAELSERAYHTWGVGWYTNGKADIKTDEGKLATSPQLEELRTDVRSRIVISHVRLATSEPCDVRGAHPFKDHALGQDWIFAHNGSVDQEWLRRHLERPPSLGPDSRFLFRYLIERIGKNARRDVEEVLAECLPELKDHTDSALNFLMCDGIKLYAFCGFSPQADEEEYTLQMTRRPRIEPRELAKLSGGYRQMLYAKHGKREKAVLVCSEGITELQGESWTALHNGELVTIERDSLLVRGRSVW